MKGRKNYKFFPLKKCIGKKISRFKYFWENPQLLKLCGFTWPFLNFHLVFFKKKKERTKEDRESNSAVGVVKTRSLRMKYVHSFGVFLSHQKVILIVNLQDTELYWCTKGIYIICIACAYIHVKKPRGYTTSSYCLCNHSHRNL